MRVKINQAFTMEEIKPKLEAAFPEYKVKFRGPKVLIISKNSTAATQLMGGQKGKCMVSEGFATLGGQFLFVITLLLLGILIPLIVYFAAFYPGQKQVTKEVAEFIRKEYGDGSVQSGNQVIDQN